MKKTPTVKNQHYIPEALLWLFTNSDGKLFEALVNVPKVYPTKPGSSMCEKFTYEDEDLEVNTIENYFAKFDGEIAPKVKKLLEQIESCKNGKSTILDVKKGVEELLPIFVIFYYRSGALLTEFSFHNKEHKIPSLTKKILNPPYIAALARTIRDFYNFAIIESDDDFLLSDQFISTAALRIKSRYFDISNRHIGLKETLVLIPLSSRYYIAYWHTERDFFMLPDTIMKVDEEQLKMINRTIINNSYVKCVAPKEERLKEVLPDFKFASPSQIFAGGNPEGFFMGAIKKKEVFFFPDEREVFKLLEYTQFTAYRNLGRNDKCACGSEKKFKKCHWDSYQRLKTILQTFGRNKRDRLNDLIPGIPALELPVEEWRGYDRKHNKSNLYTSPDAVAHRLPKK